MQGLLCIVQFRAMYFDKRVTLLLTAKKKKKNLPGFIFPFGFDLEWFSLQVKPKIWLFDGIL